MLKPSGNRILIQRESEDKLSSSIIEVVSLDGEKESVFATIVAVGPKCVEGLQPGDAVVTKKYAGAALSLPLITDGPKVLLYLINEEDVLGKVTEGSLV